MKCSIHTITALAYDLVHYGAGVAVTFQQDGLNQDHTMVPLNMHRTQVTA